MNVNPRISCGGPTTASLYFCATFFAYKGYNVYSHIKSIDCHFNAYSVPSMEI